MSSVYVKHCKKINTDLVFIFTSGKTIATFKKAVIAKNVFICKHREKDSTPAVLVSSKRVKESLLFSLQPGYFI